MKNQKGVIKLAILILVAVILLGLVAFGYFYWLPKEKENENANTNRVVVNTNLNLYENTNVNIVLDSRCEEVVATADCVDVAAPGYWYLEESGGCYYTSGEVCSNPPFTTYDECMAACTGSGSTNTNTSTNTNSNTVIVNTNNGSNVNLNTNTSTDETASWKTYNNSTYKYQIKYSDDWFTKSCSAAYTAFASEEKRLPPCETEAWGDIQISVNTDTPVAYYQEDITQTKAYLSVTSETNITVGGITAKRLAGTTKASEGPGPEEGTEEIYVVFITSNNELYHLVYYKNTEHDYSGIFDQMISTFNFVD